MFFIDAIKPNVEKKISSFDLKLVLFFTQRFRGGLSGCVKIKPVLFET